MKTVKIPSEGYGSNCWLVISDDEFVIIDPSSPPEFVKARLEQRGLSPKNLKYILLTHGHFDHITGADELRKMSGAPLAVHRLDAECLTDPEKNAYKYFFRQELTVGAADILLDEGDELCFGHEKLSVLHTPGHTKGSVCYVSDSAIYSGDTLFDLGVGRTDLYGGSARELEQSLKKVKNLPSCLELYPGHGSVSTLQKQIDCNPYLKGI